MTPAETLDVPSCLFDHDAERENAFLLECGQRIPVTASYEARYALIDPGAVPAVGDLCAFDYYGDAVIQPYPIHNDVGEFLGVVASFLGVRQVRA